MTGAPIELRSVTKSYAGEAVVREVSFTLNRGEGVALVGHNGAGKTTLMKLMLGLTRPTTGDVRVLGIDPTSAAAAKAREGVGFLPENVAFQQAMTGRDVLRFYLRLKHHPAREADALLARVGLEKAANKRVGTYSKGMRQRLGLAQALIGSPKVLLLDEPTSGLDPALRAQFYDTVQSLKAAGTTVLLSSHALTELEARTDRVAIMNQGRLVACATLAELRAAAGLPTRIHSTVPAGTGGELPARVGAPVEVAYINDRSVELTCAPDAKMRVLRGLSALGHDVRDLDITPPTLEQVYAHFLQREDAA